MTKFKSLFYSLISSGVRPTMDSILAAQIRTTNAMALILCLIDIPNITFFYLMKFNVAAVSLIGIMTCYAFTLLISRFQNGILGKYWLFIISNIAIGLFGDIFGKNAGMHFLYFPVMVTTFLMFSIEDIRQIVACIFISVGMFILTFMGDVGLLVTPWHLISGGTDFELGVVWVVMAINSYLMLAGFVGYNAHILNRGTKELIEQRASLIEARQKAEMASHAKSDFLASMSHEIRTPLGVILGFAEVLTDNESDPAKFKQLGEIILMNSRYLLSLINDILDLSKVEAGRQDKSLAAIDTGALLREIYLTFSPSASIKNIKLSIDVKDPLPRHFISDPVLFRQALVNLIGNALKFTDGGQVTVEIYRHQASPEKSVLCLRIKDTGLGIDAADFQKIFEPFTQGTKFASRRHGGTGLGLGLARKLARILGGDVTLVESTKHRGSIFLLTIETGIVPESGTIEANDLQRIISQPDTMPANLPVTGNAVLSLENTRILVAEDSPDTQILIRIFLESEGAHIDTVSDGNQCVEKCLLGNYDLVLMDIQMPGKNGYDALLELRSKQFTKQILMISAHAMVDAETKYQEAGCQSFVSKPFTKATLVSEVCKTLWAE